MRCSYQQCILLPVHPCGKPSLAHLRFCCLLLLIAGASAHAACSQALRDTIFTRELEAFSLQRDLAAFLIELRGASDTVVTLVKMGYTLPARLSVAIKLEQEEQEPRL